MRAAQTSRTSSSSRQRAAAQVTMAPGARPARSGVQSHFLRSTVADRISGANGGGAGGGNGATLNAPGAAGVSSDSNTAQPGSSDGQGGNGATGQETDEETEEFALGGVRKTLFGGAHRSGRRGLLLTRCCLLTGAGWRVLRRRRRRGLELRQVGQSRWRRRRR